MEKWDRKELGSGSGIFLVDPTSKLGSTRTGIGKWDRAKAFIQNAFRALGGLLPIPLST